MVEVFKTNIQKVAHSKTMAQKLLEHFPASKITFDLDDCDRVLRVEGAHVLPMKIIEVLTTNGYQCLVLE